MLVLSRKPGESIIINNIIEITIIDVRRDRVRIGITAPRECEIVRRELIVDEDLHQGGGKETANDTPSIS